MSYQPKKRIYLCLAHISEVVLEQKCISSQFIKMHYPCQWRFGSLVQGRHVPAEWTVCQR